MTDLSLNILLQGQDVSASSAMSTVGSAVKNLASGNVLGAVGVAAAAVGAAIIGIGVASTQMAGQYQQSFNMVQALTGSNTAQMSQYDASVKSLAVDAGVAPDALASGLYNVLSAGKTGADAMNVLKLATEDAKIGMTDATTTTGALTNILNSFSVTAADTTRVNGEMLQTVTMGKATFAQYATTIVGAASASVEFKTSMEVMNAAWATLTSSGISAAEATIDYSQSLKVMDGNIGKVSESLKKNGIAFNESKFNAMDYGDKVVYLNSALEQARAKHVSITGATLQAVQAIQTISQHIGVYNADLAALSDKQAMAQKTQQAWAITQAGFNQKMSQMSAAFQVLLITIGNALLPILSQVVGWLTPIVTQFSNWVIKSNALQNSIQTLGTWFNNLRAFLAPLGPIIGNVIAWFGQMSVSIGSNQTLWTTLWNALQQIVQFLQATFIPVWLQLVNTFNTQLKPAWVDFMTQIQPALPTLKAIGQFIAGVLIADFIAWIGIMAGTLGALAALWSGVIRAIGGIVQFISGAIQTIAGIMQFFQDLMNLRWNNLGADMGVVWGGIVRMVQGAWNTMAGISEAGVNVIIGFINGFTAAATGPINAILQAAHMAPITIGKIPSLHMSTSVGGASTFVPYQAVATDKMSTASGPTMANITAQMAQAALQAAQLKPSTTLPTTQPITPANLTTAITTPVTSSVNNASAKSADAALKAQQAAQVAAMKLADTQQKAIAASGSSQVQALVAASQQAQAQGNTALAAYDAGKAATLANQQKATATKAANATAKAAKAATAAATKAAKAASVASAKAAKASASQKAAATKAAVAAQNHAQVLAAHAAALTQSAANQKQLLGTIQQSTNQITTQQCPGGVSAITTALGVALPDYATGTGYSQKAPVIQQAPGPSGGQTVHHHYNVNVHTDSKDPKDHGKKVADEIKEHLAKTLRGQAISPRYTSGGTR